MTFRFPNGDKYRNFFPVKDEHEIPLDELALHKFDIQLFLHPDTTGVVQYVEPQDIQAISQTINTNLLVILYFPNCASAEGKMEIAEFAEQNSVPYILISDTYSPDRMKDLYSRHHLKNGNCYIIPTIRNSEDVLLKKRLSFMKGLSQDLYSAYRDELIFVTALIVSKNQAVQVHPLSKDGFQQPQAVIDWVKEKYHVGS